MEEIIQRIENVVLDANCSRDVKQMLLKLVELRSSNWGRVHAASTYREATPENDPNYFMVCQWLHFKFGYCLNLDSGNL